MKLYAVITQEGDDEPDLYVGVNEGEAIDKFVMEAMFMVENGPTDTLTEQGHDVTAELRAASHSFDPDLDTLKVLEKYPSCFIRGIPDVWYTTFEI